MKISTLGPKGTFSHEASLRYSDKAELLYENTIRDVFDSVSRNVSDVGIIPLENSVSGTVGFTIECLSQYNLNIIAEIVIPIHHYLVGKDKNKIKTLYVHEQTHAQCFNYIHNNFPRAKIVHTGSNGSSAELISKNDDPTIAAIVPKISHTMYGLSLLGQNIEDNQYNVTKFIVVSNNDTRPTGRDRTTISVFAQVDKPGLLYTLLGEFANSNINLSKIESVPSKGKLGTYFFFIDFEGHKEEPVIKVIFDKIRQDFFLKVHGSYPREY